MDAVARARNEISRTATKLSLGDLVDTGGSLADALNAISGALEELQARIEVLESGADRI